MLSACNVQIDDLFNLSFDINPKGLPPTKEATITVKLSSRPLKTTPNKPKPPIFPTI